MTDGDRLLLDTSAAIALLILDHSHHDAVVAEVEDRPLGLAGHAEAETYSVLTRLPGAGRVTPAGAVRLIETNFPSTVHLGAAQSATIVRRCAKDAIAGGAINDALVGACALAHRLPLVTCDRRAMDVYRVLGVEVRLVG